MALFFEDRGHDVVAEACSPQKTLLPTPDEFQTPFKCFLGGFEWQPLPSQAEAAAEVKGQGSSHQNLDESQRCPPETEGITAACWRDPGGE